MKQYRNKQILVFGVLAVCVTATIFWNSLQNAQQSIQLSSGLLAWLKPWLLPLFGGSEELMHEVIRKTAHFVEFAALGLCLCGVADGMDIKFWRTSLLFFPLFALLGTAVTDEFIQSFSDRTSSVKDVLLDFCGGIFGLAVTAALFAVLHSRRKRG